MYLPFIRFKAKVKGIFSSSIPDNFLLQDGDSSPYFGTYSPQRFGSYDTNCCWSFSGTNVAETRLQILWQLNLIPQDTKDWLVKYGYCTADGMFDLSERWVAILSGVKRNGNYQLTFWKIVQNMGFIPHSMLPYDATQAFKDFTPSDFDNDYFNPNVITLTMRAMGQEFLKRFSINAENIKGGSLNDISIGLQTYLKEGSMQIGIPVPQDGGWNRPFVDMPVGRYVADHAVELYKFDQSQKYPFFIYDSYEPHLKQLSVNYWIPFITRVSILPITTPILAPVSPATTSSGSPWQRFWANTSAWLQGKPIPYPNVPLGRNGV